MLLDAICYNELGDPDDLVGADGPVADWRDMPQLKLLNLIDLDGVARAFQLAEHEAPELFDAFRAEAVRRRARPVSSSGGGEEVGR